MHVESTSFTSLQNHELGETTGDIAARVRAARRCQSLRFSAHDGIHSNADAHGKLLTQTCALATETIGWLHKALDHFQLSSRGYHRMLRVARTIADLKGSDTIEKPHLSEALSFRPFPACGHTVKQADRPSLAAGGSSTASHKTPKAPHTPLQTRSSLTTRLGLHTSFCSIACQIFAAILTPSKRSSS